MWKVMAADDESYMQEALQKLISWEKMGCSLLSIAPDGKTLIERMEEERPDIVITDIRMPLVDGLAVCKYVYEKCPETQVIILSAYSDFQYARTAIRYSVCEYVLKVSVLEELPAAVEKAIRTLERNHTDFQKQIEKTEISAEKNTLLAQMTSYVENNYTRKISLDDIAEELHANRSYISRLYKSERGINLFDDILRMRINKAKELIETTPMKIYEVSLAVGFDDTGYFSKVFKKYTSMTPKDYKNGGKGSDA